MTVKWTLFNETTGAIIATGDAPNAEQANLQATGGGRIVLVDLDPKTQAVDPGTNTPIAKQPMNVGGSNTVANKATITANGTDFIQISNVPVGAKYDVYLPPNMGLVQPPDGVVNDGVLKLTTTVSGIYSVKLSYLNFLDFVVTFNAN